VARKGRGEEAGLELADACDELGGEAKGRVVVVTRGGCDFETKVVNVEKAKAVAMVVVNYAAEGDRLANMKLNESRGSGLVPSDVRIPAVMITFRDWKLIAPCRDDDDLTMSFTADGEATFDIDYGRDALNWAMMRGMALWILFQCGVNVVRYKRRHSEISARTDAIAAMPVIPYSRGSAARTPAAASPAGAAAAASAAQNDDDSEPLCAICLDEFRDGDMARKLACSHLFHRDCLDPWLQVSSSCPVCKRVVPDLPPPPPSHLQYGALGV